MGTTPTPRSTLESLGPRLRAARKQRGLSQEALAHPAFTKSYVSAIECGKAWPSLKALELLARRLEMPISDFLQGPAAPDLAALDEALAYQIDQAEVLIHMQQAEEALRTLSAAADEFRPFLPNLSVRAHYRLHYTRALAQLRLQQLTAARHELNETLPLAEQLDGETAERVRNLIGQALHAQDLPRLALEQHELCVQAIASGIVGDPHLRLSIYSNLANDYWALNEGARAVTTYQQALQLAAEMDSLERQATTYWTLSQARQAQSDLPGARRYAGQALTLYEAADNLLTGARVRTELAQFMTARGEYAEAAQLLQRALALAQPAGNDLFLSTIYGHYAGLELEQGHLGAAQEHARQSLELAQRVHEQQDAPPAAGASPPSVCSYARALRLAGQVAEQAGHLDAATAYFERAIALLQDAGADDLASEVEHTYAEVLGARGAHAQAALHYRAALQHRPPRAGR